eukprot:2235216-Prymnesium_polylepis.2
MAPLRQALGDKIHSSLVTPLESYSADADKVRPSAWSDASKLRNAQLRVRAWHGSTPRRAPRLD